MHVHEDLDDINNDCCLKEGMLSLGDNTDGIIPESCFVLLLENLDYVIWQSSGDTVDHRKSGDSAITVILQEIAQRRKLSKTPAKADMVQHVS